MSLSKEMPFFCIGIYMPKMCQNHDYDNRTTGAIKNVFM